MKYIGRTYAIAFAILVVVILGGVAATRLYGPLEDDLLTLDAAGHEPRGDAERRPPTQTRGTIDLPPPFLEPTATAALLDLLALGDTLHSLGLLGVGEPGVDGSPETGGGQASLVLPAGESPELRSPATTAPAATIALAVEVWYESEGAPRSREVLRAKFPLSELDFVPITLNFESANGSATPVLRLRDSTLSGERFEIGSTAKAGGGLAGAFGGLGGALDSIPTTIGGSASARKDPRKISDVRLSISAAGNAEPFSHSFSLRPPLSGAADDWTTLLLAATQTITVATGTPSAPYLAQNLIEMPDEERAQAGHILNHLNLTYLHLRSLLPASPDRAAVHRFIDDINVLTAAVYPRIDGKSATLVLNLARKHYSLRSGSSSEVTFVERMWNGILDRAVEQFLVDFVETAELPSPPAAARFIVVKSEPAEMPMTLTPAQLGRVRGRLAADVLIAFSETDTGTVPEGTWWEIEPDGRTEDWNVWDRHQGAIETTIETGATLKTAERERRFACIVRDKLIQTAYAAIIIAGVTIGGGVAQVSQAAGAPDPLSGLIEGAGCAAGLKPERGQSSRDLVDMLRKKRLPIGPAGGVRNPGFRPTIDNNFNRAPWKRGGRTFPGRGAGR